MDRRRCNRRGGDRRRHSVTTVSVGSGNSTYGRSGVDVVKSLHLCDNPETVNWDSAAATCRYGPAESVDVVTTKSAASQEIFVEMIKGQQSDRCSLVVPGLRPHGSVVVRDHERDRRAPGAVRCEASRVPPRNVRVAVIICEHCKRTITQHPNAPGYQWAHVVTRSRWCVNRRVTSDLQ